MDVNAPFIRSCEESLDYPKNLIQHDALVYSIEAYYERLAFRGGSLFDETPNQAAVDFLDLNDDDTKFAHNCAANLRDLKLLLREALKPGRNDPRCRFM
jgi:hypothetical protein